VSTVQFLILKINKVTFLSISPCLFSILEIVRLTPCKLSFISLNCPVALQGVNRTISNIENKQGEIDKKVTKFEQDSNGFKTELSRRLILCLLNLLI
jgi:uncharacterized Fe-S cluster-containing MiaB family protein